MRRSVTVEWESNDSVRPMGPQAFFKILGVMADLFSDCPQDATVTYDGVTARRVGGQWLDAPGVAEDDEPLPGTSLYERARAVASDLSVVHLLALGRELNLISSEEMRTLKGDVIADLLFSRAVGMQLSVQLVHSILRSVRGGP